MRKISYFLIFAFCATTFANSKVVSCAGVIGGLSAPRAPQENLDAESLVAFGTFRNFFHSETARTQGDIQLTGTGADVNTSKFIDAPEIARRLNGLMNDIGHPGDVHIYPELKRGAAVRAFLEDLKDNNKEFAQEVGRIWRERAREASAVVPPVAAGLALMATQAGALPVEQAAHVTLGALMIPLVAKTSVMWNRFAQRDAAMKAHLRFVENALNDPRSAETLPYAFYSQQVELPRVIFQRMLEASERAAIMRVLAEDHLRRDTSSELAKMARTVATNYQGMEAPRETVTAQINLMFFYEDGEPQMLIMLAERREPPSKVRLLSGEERDDDGAPSGGGGGGRQGDLQRQVIYVPY